MKNARGRNMKEQGVNVAELLFQIGLGKLLQRLSGRFGRTGNIGQLKELGDGEPTRRIAGQGPDHVDHPVPELVVELGRLAAELHGGVDLHRDASAGIGYDLVGPGLDQLGLGIGGCRQKMMDAQRDLGVFGETGAGEKDEKDKRNG